MMNQLIIMVFNHDKWSGLQTTAVTSDYNHHYFLPSRRFKSEGRDIRNSGWGLPVREAPHKTFACVRA